MPGAASLGAIPRFTKSNKLFFPFRFSDEAY